MPILPTAIVLDAALCCAALCRLQGALKELQARHDSELRRMKRKAKGAHTAVAQLTEEVATLKVGQMGCPRKRACLGV